MNDKGKFKKSTIIIMLVAVFISIGLLASVLILKGDDEYQKTHEDFYNETAPVYTKAVIADSAEENDESPDIRIAVPYIYALDSANIRSQLTDEQKDLGFKSASFDGDETITYIISENNHRSFLRTYRYDISTELEETLSRMYSSLEDFECNDELTRFTIKVNRSTFNTADGENMAAIISPLSASYRQYAQLNANCTVVIKDSASGETIATYNP